MWVRSIPSFYFLGFLLLVVDEKVALSSFYPNFKAIQTMTETPTGVSQMGADNCAGTVV
jgi:hypothetical protein